MRPDNDINRFESFIPAELATALSDIPDLVRQSQGASLGVVILILDPDTAFYRLLPESLRRFQHEINARLQEIKRSQDRLYAMSMVEWLIVLPDLRSSATLTMAMIKLQQVFDARLLNIDGITLRLTVSCGGAMHPDDGEDAPYLVQSARIASLYAKRRGEGGALYHTDMEELDDRLKRFEQEIKSAFQSESGLQLFLQPQIDARTGQCVSAETLLRWRRENGQWISPPELLAAIGRLGLRQTFNRWLFQRIGLICRKLETSEIFLRLSVNLSANDLLDLEVPDLFGQALATWSIDPAKVLLEITETSMVQQTEHVADVLKRFRKLGTQLSIDDFGTGFSGMSNLKNLPVQEVKVDRSFVGNLTVSQRDKEIIASIIDLSHRLGLRIVAEGVETQEAASLLSEMGCDLLQGFLFAPGLPLDHFIAWYRRRTEQLGNPL